MSVERNKGGAALLPFAAAKTQPLMRLFHALLNCVPCINSGQGAENCSQKSYWYWNMLARLSLSPTKTAYVWYWVWLEVSSRNQIAARTWNIQLCSRTSLDWHDDGEIMRHRRALPQIDATLLLIDAALTRTAAPLPHHWRGIAAQVRWFTTVNFKLKMGWNTLKASNKYRNTHPTAWKLQWLESRAFWRGLSAKHTWQMS